MPLAVLVKRVNMPRVLHKCGSKLISKHTSIHAISSACICTDDKQLRWLQPCKNGGQEAEHLTNHCEDRLTPSQQTA